MPLADVHLHFNWDHRELISADAVIAQLKRQSVQLGVVFSTPSELARELHAADPRRIIPLFSPYTTPTARHTWFGDADLPGKVRAALASGVYRGIGEVHLLPGIGPRRDNPVLLQLLALAAEFHVPFVIHTEAASHRYFLRLCQRFPGVRFQWAHAGGVLGPAELAPLLDACPNVWLELSARDPWHYGNFADTDGTLSPAWRAFLIRYQRRILLGSDPVWNAHQIDRWWEADEGWQHYAQLIAFHRRWLATLPPSVAERIRFTNALDFYRHGGARPSP